MKFNNSLKVFTVIACILLFSVGYSYFSTCHYFCCILGLDICLCCFEIDINVLMAIVGLYGAIVAFFIPHSIDMVSKIGNQFESENIANRFRKEPRIIMLPYHLLLGLAASFVVLFFFKTEQAVLKNIFIFFISCHFLYVLFLIHNYIKRLRFYTDTDEVLAELQKEIDNAIR